jgi:hypothetical protein
VQAGVIGQGATGIGNKNKKSRIRETKHLSTDAESSTDTIVWWTKNTSKPDFFYKTEKITKNTKTPKRLEI